ncbi:MAG: WD40 repeat domain-containing protein, partial [Cyanobacteriota bacterium ELA615]
VKLNLQSGNEYAKLTALPKALNYGEAGLDLVINALDDPDLKLKAYQLLRKRTEPRRVSQALKGIYECLKTLEGHTDDINSVAITPDGQSIVSGDFDGTIKIWNAGKCLRTLKGHASRAWSDCNVRSVAITPDGQFIVSSSDDYGGSDYTINIWDINTGECLKTLEGHTHVIWSVAITPDGQSIVSGSYDNTIKIWDINTGACIKTLEGHKNSVSSVVITPDGQYIVSGSYDNTIKIWDINTGTCIKTLEGHTDTIWSAAITPDGQYIVSGSDDKTIKIWGVPND